MSQPKKKLSVVDKAISALRKFKERKADAIFVCFLYRDGEESWSSDGIFQHWVKGLNQDNKNALPPGVPGAVISAVSAKPIQKHLGRMLKTAATELLTPHVGENATGFVGKLIDNFTKED